MGNAGNSGWRKGKSDSERFCAFHAARKRREMMPHDIHTSSAVIPARFSNLGAVSIDPFRRQKAYQVKTTPAPHMDVRNATNETANATLAPYESGRGDFFARDAQKRGDGNPARVRVTKDAGRVSDMGHGMQHARAAVEARIGGGQHSSEQYGVHDVRRAAKAHTAEDDCQRRRYDITLCVAEGVRSRQRRKRLDPAHQTRQ